MQTYIQTYIHTCIHTHMHTYIHTYIHTYMQTYIHTYFTHTYSIHTYFIHTQTLWLQAALCSFFEFNATEDKFVRIDSYSDLLLLLLLLLLLHLASGHACGPCAIMSVRRCVECASSRWAREWGRGRVYTD